MGIRHAKVSLVADSIDETLVRPTDWNDPHVGGFTPTYIRVGEEFEVPLDSQVLYQQAIVVDGVLAVDGLLIEIPPAAGGGGGLLDELDDVNAPTPADGDALVWSAIANEWIPGLGSAGFLTWVPVMVFDGTNWQVAVDGAGNAIMVET